MFKAPPGEWLDITDELSYPTTLRELRSRILTCISTVWDSLPNSERQDDRRPTWNDLTLEFKLTPLNSAKHLRFVARLALHSSRRPLFIVFLIAPGPPSRRSLITPLEIIRGDEVNHQYKATLDMAEAYVTGALHHLWAEERVMETREGRAFDRQRKLEPLERWRSNAEEFEWRLWLTPIQTEDNVRVVPMGLCQRVKCGQQVSRTTAAEPSTC